MLHGQTRYGIRSHFTGELPEGGPEWLTPRLREAGSICFGAGPDAGGQPAAATPAPRNGQERNGYRIGQTVRHARFDDGVINRLEGAGSDARAKISFGAQGIKELLLSTARLEVAG